MSISELHFDSRLACHLACSVQCSLDLGSKSGAMHADLTIDRNVRDWVFFPLMIIIILMNILRQQVHQVRHCSALLLAHHCKQGAVGQRKCCRACQHAVAHLPTSALQPCRSWPASGAWRVQYMNIGGGSETQDLKEIRQQQLVKRAKRLRTTAGVLTPEAFARRKAYFVAPVRSSELGAPERRPNVVIDTVACAELPYAFVCKMQCTCALCQHHAALRCLHPAGQAPPFMCGCDAAF